jgi:hypothetical protein
MINVPLHLCTCRFWKFCFKQEPSTAPTYLFTISMDIGFTISSINYFSARNLPKIFLDFSSKSSWKLVLECLWSIPVFVLNTSLLSNMELCAKLMLLLLYLTLEWFMGWRTFENIIPTAFPGTLLPNGLHHVRLKSFIQNWNHVWSVWFIFQF